MDDFLKFAGAVQSQGGGMMVMLWLVIEIRHLRRDFNRHEKIYHGVDA